MNKLAEFNLLTLLFQPVVGVITAPLPLYLYMFHIMSRQLIFSIQPVVGVITAPLYLYMFHIMSKQLVFPIK
ncbi:MAG: hypothetical protein JWR67_3652 [Mucilaginibacter sp.]|nr:hypothetical protein [Mucilaginibacter sp.]